MKKITFFIDSLENSGGTERITTLIANTLIDKDFSISIITLSGDKPFFALNNKIKLYNLKLHSKKNIFHLLSVIIALRKTLKKINTEYLITVSSINTIYTLPGTLGIKLKHFCWEHFNYSVGSGVKILRKLARVFCHRIFVLTKKDKELWKRNTYGNSKIIVMNNPSVFEKSTTIPSISNKTMISIGRLTEQKGFDKLINIWSKSNLESYGWKLLIIGSGSEYENLNKTILNLNLQTSVSLIPATKDISKFYKQASIYCMTSRFEGMPLVLLEALSFNLPLIAYDCYTGPSEIIKNNENGLIIENNNTKMYIDGLYKLALDKKYFDSIAKNIQKNDYFTLDSIIHEWIKNFDEI